MNDDLRKTVKKFRHSIPAEALLNRILHRVRSRISLIGLLRIDSARTQQRIRALDLHIYTLDHSDEKTREIDVNFVRTRAVDYLGSYETLDRQCKIEKASQYPVLHQLQAHRQQLIEQEQLTVDCESKNRLLDSCLEKVNQEIEAVTRENDRLAAENAALRRRLTDVKEVPSITNYAHVIGRTKSLEHDIDVWSRRVAIAEVSACTATHRRNQFGLLDNVITVEAANETDECSTAYSTCCATSPSVVHTLGRVSHAASALMQ